MSERQAKRLRRAERAYIRDNIHRLDNGPKAHDAAAYRASMIRAGWPRLSHADRGQISHHLAAGNLIQATQAIGDRS